MLLVTRMLKKLILTFALFIAMLQINLIEIKATEYNVTSCDINTYAFSVDLLTVGSRTYIDIRDNKEKTESIILYNSVGCYTSSQWYEAKAKFDQLKSEGKKDIVIRYHKTDDANFQSPLKVVLADRAMAYTQNYAYTVGNIAKNDFGMDVAKTISIFHDVTLNNRYTSLDDKEPLYYYETNKKIENNSAIPSNMVAFIEVNGAKGYIQLNGIDLIPLIYADNNAVAPFYVKLGDSSSKQLYKRNDGRFGIIPELTKYYVKNGEIQIDIDRGTSASGALTYSKAPEWLPTGTYFSANGINFYSDQELKNPILDNGQVGYFYNYYSYLNLRSKTNYTSAEIDSYLTHYDNLYAQDFSTSKMKNMGFTFIESQNNYGVNALLVYAFGIHESTYGMSYYAQERNNLFGYGASTFEPSDAFWYESIEESVKIHMGRQLRYYLDYNNSNRFNGSSFGNKGAGLNTVYADDPFWSTKIASHAYRMDQYLGFKDYNAYQIGILDPNVSSVVYKDRDLSTPLYSIVARARNYPFTINAIYNNTYYVQSTNPIVASTTNPVTYNVVTSSTGGEILYDFELSKAYIGTNQVKLVNVPKESIINLTPPPVQNDEDILVLSLKKFEWLNDTNIYLKGYAAFLNTNMADQDVSHKLTAINLENSNLKYDFMLNIAPADNNITLINPFDYSKAWFDGSVDVSSLPVGHYRFEISTSAGITKGLVSLTNSLDNAPRISVKTVNGITYTQRFHNKLKMRYELSIEKGIYFENRSPLVPSQINSISFINSMSIVDNILNMNGISFINQVNMGSLDNVRHELIFVNELGESSKYSLTSGTGTYDVSHNGFDYSNSWYFGNNLDLSSLPAGKYRVYILTLTNQYNDVVKIQDHNRTGNRVFNSANRTYIFRVNEQLRNTYDLEIIAESQTTETP